MHIITPKRLKEFYQKHPTAKPSMQAWNKRAKHAKWENFDDLQQDFRTADQVGKFTVFDVGGNNYRVITRIVYKTGKIYIRYVLTHAEYDTGKWKNDSWNT